MLLLKASQSSSEGKSVVSSTLLKLFWPWSPLRPPLQEPFLALLNPSGLRLGRMAMSVESTSAVISGSWERIVLRMQCPPYL